MEELWKNERRLVKGEGGFYCMHGIWLTGVDWIIIVDADFL